MQHIALRVLVVCVCALEQGKGPAAVAVRDMVLRMRKENPGLLAPTAGEQDQAQGPRCLAAASLASARSSRAQRLTGSACGGGVGCHAGAEGGQGPAISRAVIIDREADLVTPCMTQITLEGLIDEVTGIKGGCVPWQPKGTQASRAPSACVPSADSWLPSSHTPSRQCCARQSQRPPARQAHENDPTNARSQSA